MGYPFELPALRYHHDALEPHIDARTMEIHHGKHHQGYTNNLNAALEEYPDLHGHSGEQLLVELADLPEAIRTAVRNNGGGFVNHTLFWAIMAPGGAPCAIRRAGGGHRRCLRIVRRPQDLSRRHRWEAIRLGLGLADGRIVRRPPGVLDREPRQPALRGPQADSGRGCLGARLLPELSKSEARLHLGVVERGQLGRRCGQLLQRQGVSRSTADELTGSLCFAIHMFTNRLSIRRDSQLREGSDCATNEAAGWAFGVPGARCRPGPRAGASGLGGFRQPSLCACGGP